MLCDTDDILFQYQATFLATAWGAWWDATIPNVTELCMNLEFIFTIFKAPTTHHH